MRTNKLRALVKSVIKENEFIGGYVDDVYYGRAKKDAMYPHIVFQFDSIDIGDLTRKDYLLVIDVYDRNEIAIVAQDLADAIEDAFSAENLPQDEILPTFFLESRRTIEEPDDRLIRHEQINIVVQNYEV